MNEYQGKKNSENDEEALSRTSSSNSRHDRFIWKPGDITWEDEEERTPDRHDRFMWHPGDIEWE